MQIAVVDLRLHRRTPAIANGTDRVDLGSVPLAQLVISLEGLSDYERPNRT
jgi:hypothetical protein